MTYLMITSPLGVIMGYVMNSVVYETPGWRFSFYIQSILLAPSLFGLVFIPSKYFDLNLIATEQDKMQKASEISEDKESSSKL